MRASLTEGLIKWKCAILVVAAVTASMLRPPFCIADNEDKIQTHYQRAQEALRQNRQNEAASEFLEIIRLNPKLAEAHANLGVVYFGQGKYAQASQSFQEALKLKPLLSRAENFLGLSEAKRGHVDLALPLLERSFKHSTDDEWRQQTGLVLIEIYSARLDLDRALEVARSLQRAFPSNPEILYIAYRIHSQMGAKAVSDLVRSAPDSARLHQLTAELLESSGDFPRAVEQYRKALEIDPKLPGIHRALGVAILNSSQDETSHREAQTHFELELAVNPGDAHSEYQLGEIQWARYRYEEALKHFARAVEFRPNFVDALIALGKAWTAQGQPERALMHLEKAVRIDPENEVAHYRLALAFRKLGKSQEADRELALFKQLRDASSAIGVIYRQVQRNPVIGQTTESVQAPE